MFLLIFDLLIFEINVEPRHKYLSSELLRTKIKKSIINE